MSLVQTPSLSKNNIVALKAKKSLWPAAIVVSVAIFLLGWRFLWWPQWRALKALPTIEGFDLTKQQMEAEIKSLKELEEEYNKMTAVDRTRLDLALPQGQDIPNLLAQLEGIAIATDFSISDISFSTVKPVMEQGYLSAESGSAVSGTGGAQELKISLVIEGGGYNDLKKFITLTEESQILLKLTSLTFTNKSASKGGISYTLNFETVYLP